MNRIIIVSVLSLLIIGYETNPSFADSMFSKFGGAWRGKGTISLGDGSQEQIRCRAAYGVRGDGNALSVDMNCASDSYRVHIIANAVARGNTFSGTWQETTRQVGGDLTGRMPAPNEMQANFEAMGGGLQLSARTNGRQQDIAIRSQGADIRGATIALKR